MCRLDSADCPHRTFLKRKGGLFKKAYELSVLCSVDVAVIIFGHNKKLYEFSSGDINETLRRYQYVSLGCPHLAMALLIHGFSTANLTSTKALSTSRTRVAVVTMTMKTTKTLTMLRMLAKNPCHLHTAFRHNYSTTTLSHTLASPWPQSRLQCPTACSSLDMAPLSRRT